MVVKKEDPKKRLIQEVRYCGQDLVNRAEEFIGAIDCTTDFSIDIRFRIDGSEAPTITVSHEYYPKPMVDKYLRMGGTDLEAETKNAAKICETCSSTECGICENHDCWKSMD